MVDEQQLTSSVRTDKGEENGNTSEWEPGRFQHLELLVFNGEDSTGWVFKAESIFISTA